MTDLLRTTRSGSPGVGVPTPKPTRPVTVWAIVGAALLLFEAYIIIKWVTGPNFQRIDSGPSDPPTWMKVNLIFWQVVPIPVALFFVYRFVVRPWRRTRSVGVDGVLVLAFSTCWFWDPLSNQGNHWMVYNSWMVSYGNWASELSWWTAYSAPGADFAEPIFYAPAAYPWLLLAGAALACWCFRTLRRRYPTISTLKMLSITFVAGALFSVVIEGLIWMPLGVFEYPGGHWAIFGDTYHKYPLNEAITWAAWVTALGSLRHFTDDRGRMRCERGIDTLQAGDRTKVAIRVLATAAVTQLILIVTYHLPNTFVGLNSDEWPADLQERSYFTQNICGDGTNRLCPGPGEANFRDNSGYIDADGQPVFADKDPRAEIVPFDKGKPGGDE